MISAFVRTVLLLLALVVAGCASAATGERDVLRRDANRITAEELERATFNNLFELVRALRPAWIQPRGPMSIEDPTAGEVVVYLDGMRYGGPASLRQLRPGDVASIEYLNGTEASARFGLGHVGGAIVIHSKIGR